MKRILFCFCICLANFWSRPQNVVHASDKKSNVCYVLFIPGVHNDVTGQTVNLRVVMLKNFTWYQTEVK